MSIFDQFNKPAKPKKPIDILAGGVDDDGDWLEEMKKKSKKKEVKKDHTEVTLEILVENIPNALVFGISDPYFEFKFEGKSIYRSERMKDCLSCQWVKQTFQVPNKCFMQKVQIRVGDEETDDADDILVEFEMTFPFRRTAYYADERNENAVRLYVVNCDIHTKLSVQCFPGSTVGKLGKGCLFFEVINNLNKQVIHSSKPISNTAPELIWNDEWFKVPHYCVTEGVKLRIKDSVENAMTKVKTDIKFKQATIGHADISFPFFGTVHGLTSLKYPGCSLQKNHKV